MNAVLIGFGYWGPNIARNLNNSKKLNLYGICDNDAEKLNKAKSIYGEKIKYFTDYKDVIADKNVEMCAVALRNEIAQVVAREVLKSNKHLFMEKPVAVNMQDALLLKTLAEENNVKIHVDHIMVYNPYIKRIKEIIDSGEIGEVIYFESNRANLGPHIKNDINAMWDLAVHDLTVIDFLCGGQKALKIKGMGLKQYSTQETLTYITIQYEKFLTMLKSSWISPVKERVMVIGGTKKMIVFDDLIESEKLRIYDKGVELNKELFDEYGKYEAKVRLGDLYIPNVNAQDALLNSLEHFYDCIKENKESNSNVNQAIRILDILLRAGEDMNL